MTSTIHFVGSDFIVDECDLSKSLLDALKDCGAPGPADEAVAYVISQFTITGEPDDCRNMLRGYGAWEDDDLLDHDTNLQRLVWLTGCSLRQGESAYFSTYN